MNIEEIKKLAKEEIKEEDFRKAVDDMKVKLRAKKWWHKLIPFKIIIIRRVK